MLYTGIVTARTLNSYCGGGGTGTQVNWYADAGFVSDAVADCVFDAFMLRFSDTFEYVTAAGCVIGKAAIEAMRSTRGTCDCARAAHSSILSH